MKRAVAASVGLLALPGLAHASGFLVYDASAEALGKGSAVTASVDEPAAVWFNPGALGFLHGFGASAGGTVALASTTFTPKDGGAEVSTRPARFFLPAVFAEGEVADRLHVGVAA